jgi:hypothetical protein
MVPFSAKQLDLSPAITNDAIVNEAIGGGCGNTMVRGG